jgi:hypothetical protein
MGEHPAGNNPAGDSSALSGTAPGLELIGLLRAAAGPAERYAAASDGTVVVAAGRWDAAESWVAARKLAAIRELIRRRPAEGCETRVGELPDLWCKDLAEEIALELGISTNAADGLISLAWTLARRLPLTAAALDAGILNLGKARMIAAETSVLPDEDARAAEALAAGMWQGKTWGQIRNRIARAVVEVDPDGARKRREQAEREEARVRFWREQAGTAALAGYGLPTDQALQAHQNIQARALAYKRHGIKEPLELLRVMAMMDLLNGADARDRYPAGDPPSGTGAAADHNPPHGHGPAPGEDGGVLDDESANGPDDPGPGPEDYGEPEDYGPDQDGNREDDGPAAGHDDEPETGGPDGPEDDEPDEPETGRPDGPEDDEPDEPEDGGPGGPWNGGPGGPGGAGGGPDTSPADGDGLAANVELTIPLATLLGLAERPGEAHGLGVLDPGLVRRLAAEAARNPRSVFEIILTDPKGRAIGYGKAVRRRRTRRDTPPPPGHQTPGGTRDDTAMAAFASARTDLGDGYGAWQLRIGDLEFTVTLIAIPEGECEHRYESKGYRPSGTLRRLVQVRDGHCTMPVCVRHPRGTDFEHAVPWPQGRTCTCNGGCRCRHHHRVKQSKGWDVEQLPSGLHRWTTPAGKQYIKGPRQYPA